MEIKKESSAQAEQKAKDLYRTIGHAWCLVLKTNIIFTRDGFDHLIGKRGVLRPKSERRRRFDLLPLAKEILADPEARFTCEERPIAYRTKINRAHVTLSEMARFWIFRKENGDKTVILVVRQINDHSKHFLSIFERTRKAAQ